MTRAAWWGFALVITLMLIDAWMPDAAAATGSRSAGGPGARAMVRP
jgi:hypothetical protein